MGKFNWRTLVGTVAPALGTALGGPLIGMAVSAIGKAVLGKDDATHDEIEAAMANATPEMLLKLKQADQAFALEMKKLDVDIYALETKDVQSARALFSVNYWPQMILSALFVGGYFIILSLYITGHVMIEATLKDTVTVLIGIMSASVTGIMGFWFGSSFGSREKTAALAASQPADKGN